MSRREAQKMRQKLRARAVALEPSDAEYAPPDDKGFKPSSPDPLLVGLHGASVTPPAPMDSKARHQPRGGA